jgi:hypothetical protein
MENSVLKPRSMRTNALQLLMLKLGSGALSLMVGKVYSSSSCSRCQLMQRKKHGRHTVSGQLQRRMLANGGEVGQVAAQQSAGVDIAADKADEGGYA